MFGNRKKTATLLLLYFAFGNVFTIVALALVAADRSLTSWGYLVFALMCDWFGRQILQRGFSNLASINPDYVPEARAPNLSTIWVFVIPWFVGGMVVGAFLSTTADRQLVDFFFRVATELKPYWLPGLSEQSLPAVAERTPIYEVFRSISWLGCGPVSLALAAAMSKQLPDDPWIDRRLPFLEKGLLCLLLIVAFCYNVIVDFDITTLTPKARGWGFTPSTYLFFTASCMTAGIIFLYGIGMLNVMQCYLKADRRADPPQPASAS